MERLSDCVSLPGLDDCLLRSDFKMELDNFLASLGQALCPKRVGGATLKDGTQLLALLESLIDGANAGETFPAMDRSALMVQRVSSERFACELEQAQQVWLQDLALPMPGQKLLESHELQIKQWITEFRKKVFTVDEGILQQSAQDVESELRLKLQIVIERNLRLGREACFKELHQQYGPVLVRLEKRSFNFQPSAPSSDGAKIFWNEVLASVARAKAALVSKVDGKLVDRVSEAFLKDTSCARSLLEINNARERQTHDIHTRTESEQKSIVEKRNCLQKKFTEMEQLKGAAETQRMHIEQTAERGKGSLTEEVH